MGPARVFLTFLPVVARLNLSDSVLNFCYSRVNEENSAQRGSLSALKSVNLQKGVKEGFL